MAGGEEPLLAEHSSGRWPHGDRPQKRWQPVLLLATGCGLMGGMGLLGTSMSKSGQASLRSSSGLASELMAAPKEVSSKAIKGFVETTSKGWTCKPTSKCDFNGEAYQFCFTTNGDWDYCSPRPDTSKGWTCKYGTKCEYGSRDYQWCPTTNGQWDYCAANAQQRSSKGEICVSDHGCVKAGQDYYWCRILCTASIFDPLGCDDSWDYCTPHYPDAKEMDLKAQLEKAKATEKKRVEEAEAARKEAAKIEAKAKTDVAAAETARDVALKAAALAKTQAAAEANAAKDDDMKARKVADVKATEEKAEYIKMKHALKTERDEDDEAKAAVLLWKKKADMETTEEKAEKQEASKEVEDAKEKTSKEIAQTEAEEKASVEAADTRVRQEKAVLEKEEGRIKAAEDVRDEAEVEAKRAEADADKAKKEAKDAENSKHRAQ